MASHKKFVSISRKILGIEPEWPSHPTWALLSGYIGDYGMNEVVSAFERWAQENRGIVRRYPIDSFCKQAGGILQGFIEVGPNPELDSLCAQLFEIGGQAFTGKERQGLTILRKTWTDRRILKGYKRFVESLDEFKLTRAPRDFIDGGATAVLLTLQKESEARKLAAEEQKQAEAIAAEQAAKDVEFMHSEPEKGYEGELDDFGLDEEK